MNINPHALLQLLQLTSPSLPIGGFAWSQGLESAIDQQWLKDETDFTQWLQGIIEHSFVYQEWPLLIRLYNAAQKNNDTDMQHWNQTSLALRETAELRQEDTQMGAALLRLMRDLNFERTQQWRQKETSYLTAFAFAAIEKNIPVDAACYGLAWGWLENQITAALKSFPMGQTAGQRVFQQLVERIPDLFEHAQSISDSDIGLSVPGVVMASMQHEDQYSRLFRS